MTIQKRIKLKNFKETLKCLVKNGTDKIKACGVECFTPGHVEWLGRFDVHTCASFQNDQCHLPGSFLNSSGFFYVTQVQLNVYYNKVRVRQLESRTKYRPDRMSSKHTASGMQFVQDNCDEPH